MTPETIERLAREAGITLPSGMTAVEFATFLLQLTSFAALVRTQALEEAAQAVKLEHLTEPSALDEGDAAYDRAVHHCFRAIRALASK